MIIVLALALVVPWVIVSIRQEILLKNHRALRKEFDGMRPQDEFCRAEKEDAYTSETIYEMFHYPQNVQMPSNIMTCVSIYQVYRKDLEFVTLSEPRDDEDVVFWQTPSQNAVPGGTGWGIITANPSPSTVAISPRTIPWSAP